MKIKFAYTLKNEVDRVIYTLEGLEFTKSNGYRITLPSGVDGSFLQKDKHNELLAIIKGDMEYSGLETYKENIRSNWKKFGDRIEQSLEGLELGFPEVMTVKLTKYGTGGSFWPPSRIICNMQWEDSQFAFENFVHELIHCVIHKGIIQRYGISHWDKESLVDYQIISKFKDIFPEYKYQKKEPSKELLEQVGWD